MLAFFYGIMSTMKKNIKEIIVCEGKHDVQRVSQVVEADFLISHGTHFSKNFLELCRQLNETRGIIIFTDPDGPGAYIRKSILAVVKDCKVASLPKQRGKVGVEHADSAMILEALSHVATFCERVPTIAWAAYCEFGLTGKTDSQAKRQFVLSALHLPMANGKQAFKILGMAGITHQQLMEVCQAYADRSIS